MAVPASRPIEERAPSPRRLALKRVALAATTAFLAVNIWTGAPVFALWVGSRFVGQQVLSMKAVLIVLVVFSTLVFTMALLLTWLNNVYKELIGRTTVEQRAAWLHPLSDASEVHLSQRVGITLVERIVIISVYLAMIALLVWFVFLAGSPLPLS